MHRLTLLLSTLAVVWGALVAAPAPAIAQPENPYLMPMPERLVVLGFTAGQFEPLRATLLDKGLIDEEGRWAGGEAHYVQLGDVLLFGDDVLQSLEFLHSLSREASQAGGRVTMILGPSLYMALRDDIANVPPENYAALATDDSEAKLDAHLDALLEDLWEYNADYGDEQRQRLGRDFEEYYLRTHKPGAVEFLERIAPETELGAWLRSAPAVIRIGDVVLSNGGVSEEFSTMSLAGINEQILADANRDYVWVPKMADMKSPIWWKELSTQRVDTMTPRVDEILLNLGADALIVAHSPALGESLKRGRVYHIQSGLSLDAAQEAVIAALEVTAERWVISVGGRRFATEAPRPMPRPTDEAPEDAG